ncbi:MAG: Spy/CpxP family protein refolding chaperone [Bdellovibrionota bacterium]
MNSILKTLVFGVFALTLSASVGHAKGGHGGGGGFKHMMKDLNLTDEQKEKAKKIHGDHSDVKAKRDAMKKAHDDLETAIKGTASADEVRAKFAALQKVQDEFEKARFDKIVAIREILTPEQRSKMKSPRGMHKGGRHGGEGDDE